MRGIPVKTIVNDVYKDDSHIELFKKFTKEEILAVVSTVFTEIKDMLTEGENVYIPEFGSLQVRYPKSKTRVSSISTTGRCNLYPRIVFKSSFRVNEEVEKKDESQCS